MRYAFVYLAIFATCFLALGQPGKVPVGAGLQPGDHIRIRPIDVGHGFSSLFDLDLAVDEDGRVSIPAFDLNLEVRTLQPEDAEVIIRSELREASDLAGLDLSIFATRDGLPLPGQHCVTVSGQVQVPGPVALKPGMTLAEAITAAGGASTWGSTKRIRIYREGTVAVYDLNNPAHANRTLVQNDTIDVPARHWVGR